MFLDAETIPAAYFGIGVVSAVVFFLGALIFATDAYFTCRRFGSLGPVGGGLESGLPVLGAFLLVLSGRAPGTSVHEAAALVTKRRRRPEPASMCADRPNHRLPEFNRASTMAISRELVSRANASWRVRPLYDQAADEGRQRQNDEE